MDYGFFRLNISYWIWNIPTFHPATSNQYPATSITKRAALSDRSV